MPVSPEQIQAYVLNAVCDDWEDLSMILREVGKEATFVRTTISLAEVLEAVAELLKNGCIRAALLSPTSDAMPVESLPVPIDYGNDSLHLLITGKGQERLQAAPVEWFPGAKDY